MQKFNWKELISIIVPVYNADKHLDKCLDSLIGQSYSNIEIILVNDGSIDGSLNICQKYAEIDNRIMVINKENGGVSSARNLGLEVATGGFVMFCDSDDFVHPQWCERLLTAHSDSCLVMCHYSTFTAENYSGECLRAPSQTQRYETIAKKDFIFHQSDGFWSPVLKLYDMRIIKENKITFPIELSLGEDLTFILRYLSAINGNMKLIEETLYYYRVDDRDSLSKRAPTLRQCEFFNDILIKYLIEFGQKEKNAFEKKDQIIMYDFEKLLIKMVKFSNKSFLRKYNEVHRVVKSNTYRQCCKNGKISTNKVYSFLLRNRLALFLTLFYL